MSPPIPGSDPQFNKYEPTCAYDEMFQGEGLARSQYAAFYQWLLGSGQDATPEWVEALLPRLGWVGFDPTNNSIAAERHIRVAVGP